MHNSTVLVGVTMAAAALAAPIDATPTSDVVSHVVTNSAPGNAKGETLPVLATWPSSPHPKGTGVSEFEQEIFSRLGEALRKKLHAEDLNPCHNPGKSDEKDQEPECRDPIGQAECNRSAEKRDGARKHGVVCTIL